MKVHLALTSLALTAAGCSLVLPPPQPVEQPEPAIVEPPEIVEPPVLMINGEPGKPVTWCWEGGCVDGFLHDPSMAPAIAEPFDVRLPPHSQIESVSAIGPGPPGRQESVEVRFSGAAIGEIPEGAIMLNVFIRFAGGGDGSYYWALNRPPETP